MTKLHERLTVGGLALVALIFRLWHLQYPKGFVFDEVYYAQNANSLLHHGVEIDGKTHLAQFIVHPPIGKWMIAAGIKLLGYHEFGWRIAAALIGTASIVLVYYVAKELFHNYFLSLTAAILMCADGLNLVMSRTALLDIFLMFFILLGFYFLLRGAHTLVGISLGLAAATKWNGVYYIAAYLLYVLYIDYKNNRIKEIAPLRFAQYALLPAFVYIASWVGWFSNSSGYDRNWAKTHSGGFFDFIPSAIRSWWHYHSEILNFHTHLVTPHGYSANPWNWLVMGRPTSFFYQTPLGCGAKTCSQEVLALGTPLLWWAGVIAIAITFGYWITRTERTSILLLLSLAAGYLPWFAWQKRTVFSFYAIAFEPFIILIIVFVLSKFLEPDEGGNIPKIRSYATYGFIALIVLNFLYFFPLFTGGIISYSHWSSLMWLPSWI